MLGGLLAPIDGFLAPIDIFLAPVDGSGATGFADPGDVDRERLGVASTDTKPCS
jgi:hypothetical protein